MGGTGGALGDEEREGWRWRWHGGGKMRRMFRLSCYAADGTVDAAACWKLAREKLLYVNFTKVDI